MTKGQFEAPTGHTLNDTRPQDNNPKETPEPSNDESPVGGGLSSVDVFEVVDAVGEEVEETLHEGLSALNEALDAEEEEDVSFQASLTALRSALDVDVNKDGLVSTREAAEAAAKALNIPIPRSTVTLLVASLELLSAVLVMRHVSGVQDMAPIVYLMAFLISFFLLAAIHYTVAIWDSARFSAMLWFLMVWKFLLSLFLGFILWERHQPHYVWDAGGSYMTETSMELAVAAVLMIISALSMMIFRVVLATERFIWGAPDSGEPAMEGGDALASPSE